MFLFKFIYLYCNIKRYFERLNWNNAINLWQILNRRIYSICYFSETSQNFIIWFKRKLPFPLPPFRNHNHDHFYRHHLYNNNNYYLKCIYWLYLKPPELARIITDSFISSIITIVLTSMMRLTTSSLKAESDISGWMWNVECGSSSTTVSEVVDVRSS